MINNTIFYISKIFISIAKTYKIKIGWIVGTFSNISAI